MIKRRLTLLARHLENLSKLAEKGQKPAREFNLRGWYYSYCGTSACAVGEATFIPELSKLGLSLHLGAPMYKDLRGWQATEAFFGLNERQAEKLFSIDYYSETDAISPAVVAARIRKAVAAGDAWLA